MTDDFLESLLAESDDEPVDLRPAKRGEPEAPLDGEAVARAIGVTGLVARAILLEALERRRGFLQAALEPGTVTIVRAPDAEWAEEIAIAWRVILNPDEAAAVLQAAPIVEEEVGDNVLAVGRRKLASVRRKGLPRPYRMIPLETKVAGPDKRLVEANVAIRKGVPSTRSATTPSGCSLPASRPPPTRRSSSGDRTWRS